MNMEQALHYMDSAAIAGDLQAAELSRKNPYDWPSPEVFKPEP